MSIKRVTGKETQGIDGGDASGVSKEPGNQI